MGAIVSWHPTPAAIVPLLRRRERRSSIFALTHRQADCLGAIRAHEARGLGPIDIQALAAALHVPEAVARRLALALVGRGYAVRDADAFAVASVRAGTCPHCGGALDTAGASPRLEIAQ